MMVRRSVVRATAEPKAVRTRRARKRREVHASVASTRRTVCAGSVKLGEGVEDVLRIWIASSLVQRESAEPRATNGQLNALSSKGPMKLLGTAPGNSTWSYCGLQVSSLAWRSRAGAYEWQDLRFEAEREDVADRVKREAFLYFCVRVE